MKTLFTEEDFNKLVDDLHKVTKKEGDELLLTVFFYAEMKAEFLGDIEKAKYFNKRLYETYKKIENENHK